MPEWGAVIGLSPVVAYEGAHFSASPAVLGRSLKEMVNSHCKLLLILCMHYVHIVLMEHANMRVYSQRFGSWLFHRMESLENFLAPIC